MKAPLTKRKFILTVTALSLLLMCALLVGASIGSAPVYPWDWLTLDDAMKKMWVKRILDYRLKRSLLAGIIGGALALAGAGFQAILRNPLAEPYLLGVMGGGAFGAITALILNLRSMSVRPAAAFVGTVLSMAIVWRVAGGKGWRASSPRSQNLILAGVIVNAFFAGVIMFLTSILGSEKVKSFMFWVMGDLSSERSYGWLIFVAIYALSGMLLIVPLAKDYNLLSLGEDSARQLGSAVDKVKLRTFIGVSLITASCVSVAGLIGFVGLIIPHTLRLMFGADHRLLLPSTLLGGATFLILCDALSRAVFPTIEIPIGAVTAFFGGPFFLWLLRNRSEKIFEVS